MVASASFDRYDGIGEYRQLGWVPADRQSSSASKTLEFAYDDWTIARMAEAMGRDDVAAEFDAARGLLAQPLRSRTPGFLRARNADGVSRRTSTPCPPTARATSRATPGTTRSTCPTTSQGFMDLLGGPEKLVDWLDGLFVMEVDDESIAHNEDITRAGMIGNYVHGNEPSHHVPYLYCFAGQPWKTQARVRQIMDEMYRPAPDGLCGNDDCGQMSAWYVFSPGLLPGGAGQQPVRAGQSGGAAGRDRSGRRPDVRVVPRTRRRSTSTCASVRSNGEPLDRSYITHDEVMRAGNCGSG